jgi:hypothetical protein
MEIYAKVESNVSFKSISYIVNHALADSLEAKGLTEQQILDYLSSTRIRHALDQSLGEALAVAVNKWAETQSTNDFIFG